MKSKNNTVLKAVCMIATLLCAPSYSGEDAPKRFLDRFGFLTEYYFDQDARTFSNHKNDELFEIHMMAAETNFEVIFLSYEDFLHFSIMYSYYFGGGQQDRVMAFDPRLSNYAIIPVVELRHKDIFYQIGLDHRCFHQIDREPEIVPYWNQVYAKALSGNYRYQQMQKNYIGNGRDGYLDRLKWSAWAGYFMKKFGGMNPTLVSGNHPWDATLGVSAGYSFYKTKSWMFSGRNNLVAFIDTTGKFYWTGLAGVDADLYTRRLSFGIFIDYNYEFPRELPWISRDQLFEWGVRWRF